MQITPKNNTFEIVVYLDLEQSQIDSIKERFISSLKEAIKTDCTITSIKTDETHNHIIVQQLEL